MKFLVFALFLGLVASVYSTKFIVQQTAPAVPVVPAGGFGLGYGYNYGSNLVYANRFNYPYAYSSYAVPSYGYAGYPYNYGAVGTYGTIGTLGLPLLKK